MKIRIWPLALLIAASACSEQPPVDLATRLRGIEKSKFLACSGPPQLAYDTAAGERISMVTNLDRGVSTGLRSAASSPVDSCSVDATFAKGRLVSSVFGGNPAICDAVFRACMDH
jgi:hypothetical protein